MTSSLDILRDDIRPKVSITPDASALGTESSSATNVSNPHTPPHADIVASNMVKTVVNQTVMEQCKIASCNSCLVVYGFPEEGNDYDELVDMFDYLSCHCEIVRHQRMRYAARCNSAGRPIKVELRSTSAITFILSHAKYFDFA